MMDNNYHNNNEEQKKHDQEQEQLHSFVGLERQLMIHTITLQRLMNEIDNAKTVSCDIKAINALSEKVSKEKYELEKILEEGENMSGELNPNGQFDILAHKLIQQLNDEQHYLV